MPKQEAQKNYKFDRLEEREKVECLAILSFSAEASGMDCPEFPTTIADIVDFVERFAESYLDSYKLLEMNPSIASLERVVVDNQGIEYNIKFDRPLSE